MIPADYYLQWGLPPHDMAKVAQGEEAKLSMVEVYSIERP
jgi:hypothetical protein